MFNPRGLSGEILSPFGHLKPSPPWWRPPAWLQQHLEASYMLAEISARQDPSLGRWMMSVGRSA
jgi:hypothetical protein